MSVNKEGDLLNFFPDNVMLLQFQRFVQNQEKANGIVIDHLFKKFMEEKYPGVRSSPAQMVAIMTSPDPSQALSVQTNVNPPDPSDDPCAEETNSRKKRESQPSEDKTGWCPFNTCKHRIHVNTIVQMASCKAALQNSEILWQI